MRAAVVLSILFVATAVQLRAGDRWPAPLHESTTHWCATGEIDQEQERLAALNELRSRLTGPRIRSENTTPRIRYQDGMFIVPATPSMAPLDAPVDLAEKTTIHFRRLDAERYQIARGEYQYVDKLGRMTRAFSSSGGGDWHFVAYPLKFEFPFYDEKRTSLFLSAMKAIYFEAPSLSSAPQSSAIDIFSTPQALIAPLLHATASSGVQPALWINDDAPDAVTITWKSQPHSTFEYDIQATLRSNGDISFTYKTLRNVSWGTVAVTSGKESWRSARRTLAAITDSESDASIPAGAIAGALEITNVEVNRIGGSDLLEFRIRLKGPFDQKQIPAGGYGYSVEIENVLQTQFVVFPTSTTYAAGYLAPRSNSPAATIEGDTLVFRALEKHLVFPSREVKLRITSGTSPAAASDSVTTTLFLGNTSSAEVDFANVNGAEESRPLVESFTLSAISVLAIWSEIKRQFGYDDLAFSSVAIFQSFLTDIITYASAYSTVGNPGVDGVSNRSTYGTNRPRFPGLLHMNRVDFSFNTRDEIAMHVLAHEFGHHWLYFFRFMDGSVRSTALNPGGGHPAQYVHTPAAFNVYTSSDSSVMGGATFTDNGNGTFTTPSTIGYYGYSWHDLYLMGLASPDEVPPWYYLEGSGLGNAYYPPTGGTYSGTRKNVTIQQVISAMGPRKPAYPESPKDFKLAMVLLERPDSPATEAQIAALKRHRNTFKTYFPTATGGRASVETITALPALEALFDFAPSVVVSGVAVQFTDRSRGAATSWQWDFGNGQRSTERSPVVTFPTNGIFEVKLTVGDGTNSKTTSRSVAVTSVGGTRTRRR